MLAFSLSLAFVGVPSPITPQSTTAESLPLVREGEHFRVLCHFDCARAADEALASVEALFPAADELYGAMERERRDVHLYRNAADYQAAEHELTKGAFARNLAFAHFDTVSAHVALQPAASLAVLERFGLPRLTRELLAHEAAHLLRYDAFENFRVQPRWFVDGAADWLDFAALRALELDTDAAIDPKSSSAVLRLVRLRDRDALPSVERTFSTALEGLDFYEGYAARELWSRFLFEEEPRRMAQVVDAIRRSDVANESEFTAEIYGSMRDVFGSRFGALDRRFARWVDEFEPAWDQVRRSLERRTYDGKDAWLQIAFDSSNALAWRTADCESKRYSVGGTLEVLPGKGRQMNLLLGCGERGFVSVAFVAGYGVTVFDYVSRGSEWNRLASVEHAAVQAGEPFAFEALVEGDALTIRVAGEDVVTLADTKHDLRGPWGLGAQRGSAGLWGELVAPGLD